MKKINKKVLSFALVGIFVLALATAGLVGYLSNKVTADVTVESPFEIGIAEGNQGTPSMPSLQTVSLTALYGGDTIRVTTGFHYLGSETINVIQKYTIVNAGISCNDFESIKWTTCTGSCNSFGSEQTLDLVSLCYDSGDTLTISYPNIYDAGEYNVDNFALKLKADALGTYTFSAQVVPTA
jgi:hypothetical protein